MTNIREFREFSEIIREKLRDPELAVAYLNEALASGDKKVFLIALRDVIEARGNVKSFAEKAEIPRQSIYRMLSEGGNPTLEKLTAIFEAMGLKIQITLA